jgi:hypothetical protein
MEAKLSFELPEGKDMNEYLYELIKKAENDLKDLKTQEAFVDLKKNETRPDCDFGVEFTRFEENELKNKIDNFRLSRDRINTLINESSREVVPSLVRRFNRVASKSERY